MEVRFVILKIWTLTQLSEVESIVKQYDIPIEVLDVVKNNLAILDASYGTDRSITADGGYVAMILPEENHSNKKEYEKLLQEYHLSKEDAEFEDSLCIDGENRLWKSDTYIMTEFSLILIYTVEGE